VLADDQIYIGSTANFATRKSVHKTNCNNVNDKSYNLKVYQIIRANGGWENWRMDYVEQLPNHTLVQSKIREQYYINLLKSKLNSYNAYTDQVAYHKQYRDTHKEEKSEHNKEYRNNNQDKLIKHSKDYYYNNQDKIREKTNCNCGGHYRYDGKARHFKSKLHLAYLSSPSVEQNLPVVDPVFVPS
tara:strand:+ start:279 stop:836 length:558 start_codon:yes stop_codon:yes gene_type:complete